MLPGRKEICVILIMFHNPGSGSTAEVFRSLYMGESCVIKHFVETRDYTAELKAQQLVQKLAASNKLLAVPTVVTSDEKQRMIVYEKEGSLFYNPGHFSFFRLWDLFS